MTTPPGVPPGFRWVPPPNWPPASPGWYPTPGWEPPADWGAVPPGWVFWQPDPSAVQRRGWSGGKIASLVVAGVAGLLLFAGCVAAVSSGGGDDLATTSDSNGESEPAAFNPADYQALTNQTFQKLVKNPDAQKGERFVLYGYVTQFDAATGTDQFLASVGATRLPAGEEFDYDELAYFTGSASALDPAVKDDLIKVYVVGRGSFSYDTQIGGNTTVPKFKIDRIEVLGNIG